MVTYRHLLAFADRDFAKADPLVMNLLVAKSIPSSAHLEIDHYVELRDQWAEGVLRRLPNAEKVFSQNPARFRNDMNFLRLAVLCEYLDCELGIAYKEDQRNVTSVYYTDPADLFLNGVMDTLRGTCGSMAALHVAIGWRLGWPVSLAAVKSHYVLRYDDGRVTYNIEATQAGYGGFKSDSDEYLMKQYDLPLVAVSSGSDLRAVTPREMLGIFIGLRGRHMRDVGQGEEAESSYLLARHLFPTNRRLYVDALAVIGPRGATLFAPGEIGAPDSFQFLARDSAATAAALPVPALDEQMIRDLAFAR